MIIYGDSQGQDMFYALSNDSSLGIKYFGINYKCSAFFSPDKTYESEVGLTESCKNAFEILINSDELRSANILFYAHDWSFGKEYQQNYEFGIKKLLEINPSLKIIFVGPKPIIGEKWESINKITQHQKSRIGLNDFLNLIKNNRIDDENYAKNLSATLGVSFLSVGNIFCDNNICPFFVEDNFTYFDQNHWTIFGANLFYLKLINNIEFVNFMKK